MAGFQAVGGAQSRTKAFMITRRQATGFLAAALPTLTSRAFGATTWPDRPVHLVVTFIAGGANDIVARIMGDRLGARLGQQFVIENRAGAGGNVGVEYVVHQPPDGYTFLQLSNAAAANMSLYPNLTFNPLTDLAPVAGVYEVPFVIVVSPDFPAKTMAEFISYAKANPGLLNHGSGGVGSISHIAAELFKMKTGASMTHVPYRGSPQVLSDLLGGRLQCAWDPLPTSLPYILDGKLRAIAVTSVMRSPHLPDTPAVAETLVGYDATSITGTAAPKSVDPAIIDRLSAEIARGLGEADVQTKIGSFGATPLRLSANQFGDLLRSEAKKWAEVIAFAHIKPI